MRVFLRVYSCVCACVCVRVCARARARVCMCGGSGEKACTRECDFIDSAKSVSNLIEFVSEKIKEKKDKRKKKTNPHKQLELLKLY